MLRLPPTVAPGSGQMISSADPLKTKWFMQRRACLPPPKMVYTVYEKLRHTRSAASFFPALTTTNGNLAGRIMQHCRGYSCGLRNLPTFTLRSSLSCPATVGRGPTIYSIGQVDRMHRNKGYTKQATSRTTPAKSQHVVRRFRPKFERRDVPDEASDLDVIRPRF